MTDPQVIHPLDTHCHIDLYPDPAGIVRKMAARGVRGIAVTNAPFVFPHTQKLVAGCPGLKAALGLHPELAVERAKEIDLFRAYLPQTRFVGEVGLDFVTTDRKVRELQRKLFGDILQMCADAGDKVLTVHSRRAAGEVIDAVGSSFRSRVILHWFSGTIKELEKAQNYGMFFSVNQAMTVSKSGQTLIRRMDPARVLTETDGPFLKIGDSPAQPWDATLTYPFLGEIWGVSAQGVAERVNQTFETLFGPVQPTPLSPAHF